MVGAGGIARRRPDALVRLPDQLGVAERLVPGVAPELAPHPLVQPLGERLGQPVGERLGEDGAVVVVSRLELRHQRVEPMPGGDREGADMIGHAALSGSHEVGEREIRTSRRLGHLLPEGVDHGDALAARSGPP